MTRHKFYVIEQHMLLNFFHVHPAQPGSWTVMSESVYIIAEAIMNSQELLKVEAAFRSIALR